jgi:hypothetical protein
LTCETHRVIPTWARRSGEIAIAFTLVACGQARPSDPQAAPPTHISLATVAPASVAPASVAPPSGTIRVASPDPTRLQVARSDLHLPSGRSRAVALVIGSRILVCGGLTATGSTTGSIIAIDVGSGRVSRARSLAVPVHDAGGAILGGSWFVFGGGQSVPGTIVQQVGTAGPSVVVGRLAVARADLAAVSVDGGVILVGGGTTAGPDDRVLGTADGRRFTTVAKLLVGVRYAAVAAMDGLVYVIGGSTVTGDSRAIQSVDPRTGVVRLVGHLAGGLAHASAFIIDGALLIAGGRAGGRAQDGLWHLDLADGTVTRIGRLPYAASDMAAAVVDDTGYLIGGEGTGRLASVMTVGLR